MNKALGEMWLHKFEFVVEISLQERGKCYLSWRLSGKEELGFILWGNGKRLLGFKMASDLIGSLQFRMSTLWLSCCEWLGKKTLNTPTLNHV